MHVRKFYNGPKKSKTCLPVDYVVCIVAICCGHVICPLIFLQQCDNFVSKYGEDIIKLLLEAVSPKVVCSVLHLCLAEESSVVVMPVVESGKRERESVCVWGGGGGGGGLMSRAYTGHSSTYMTWYSVYNKNVLPSILMGWGPHPFSVDLSLMWWSPNF